VRRRRKDEPPTSGEAEQGSQVGFGRPVEFESAESNAKARLPDPPLPDESIPAPFDFPRPGHPVDIEVDQAATRLPDPLVD
jgi:hypothetical protein